MISFIIPAHNEETLVGRAIDSIRQGAAAAGQAFEVIVVNDDSTDATADVARRHDAAVVDVALRRISAVRNAGAKSARGEILIFVDADTVVPAGVLSKALAALRNGAIGGGASVAFDAPCPFWGRFLLNFWNLTARRLRWAAGCFVFVRRDAFEAVGGFDESYFVGEELILSDSLKKLGRFVVLYDCVQTSPRKAHLYSMFEMTWFMIRMSLAGQRAWQDRKGLDMWYARRSHPPQSAARGVQVEPRGPGQGK